MSKITKEYIDDLVNIWLDQVQSIEQGWPSSSTLSRFADYAGSFQASSIVNGLEIYVDRQHKRDARFADIDLALTELEEKRALAIIAKRLLQGINADGRAYTNADRARMVGMEVRQYENNLAAAYKDLEKTLTLLKKRQAYTTYLQ